MPDSISMDVHEAIAAAEALLPGVSSPDGEVDPRWQAIIEVSEFITESPEPVWRFTEHWGAHPDADLQAAVASCLLEHLLEAHFDRFFPRVATAVRSNRDFASTFQLCSKFGQSEEPEHSRQFDALKDEAGKHEA